MMSWIARFAVLTAILTAVTLGAAMAAAERPIVIAHRGASGYLPEHTLQAAAAAHVMGADFIEQDVVLSADGVPMVLHDIHIDTVTNVAELFPERVRDDGRYYAIDFSLDELKRLSVHERTNAKTGEPVFPARFPQGVGGFKIATLEEQIGLIEGLNQSTGRDVGLYVEIKRPAWHRMEGSDISAIVLQILADRGYSGVEDALFVQCFDWAETQRIRNELGYEGRLVQLIGGNDWPDAAGTDYDQMITVEGLADVAAVADGIGPWLKLVLTEKGTSTGLVEAAQATGLDVHPFTFRADALPPSVDKLEMLIDLAVIETGADGFFTDQVDRSLAFINGMK